MSTLNAVKVPPAMTPLFERAQALVQRCFGERRCVLYDLAFGIDVAAREIRCRAHGDPVCRFVMAAPGRIERYVATFRGAHPNLFPAASVPGSQR